MLYAQSLMKKLSGSLALVGSLLMPFSAEAESKDEAKEAIIEILEKYDFKDPELIVQRKNIRCYGKYIKINFILNPSDSEMPLWDNDEYEGFKDAGYKFGNPKATKAEYYVPFLPVEEGQEEAEEDNIKLTLPAVANDEGKTVVLNTPRTNKDVKNFVKDMRRVQCLMSDLDENSGCEPCKPVSMKQSPIYKYQA